MFGVWFSMLFFCVVWFFGWFGGVFGFCLGFFSVVDLLGFFLQSSSYCEFGAHSLGIPVLQTSVCATEMAVKGEVRKSYASHSNKSCQKCCTAEVYCMHLPVALWKMVINVCCVCAWVYTENGQEGNLSLLTS